MISHIRNLWHIVLHGLFRDVYIYIYKSRIHKPSFGTSFGVTSVHRFTTSSTGSQRLPTPRKGACAHDPRHRRHLAIPESIGWFWWSITVSAKNSSTWNPLTFRFGIFPKLCILMYLSDSPSDLIPLVIWLVNECLDRIRVQKKTLNILQTHIQDERISKNIQ